MSQVSGVAKSIQVKNGMGKNGKPYTMYSVFITQQQGNDLRVGWGFEPPPFQEGQAITCEIEQNGSYYNWKKNTAVKAEPFSGTPTPAAAAPARDLLRSSIGPAVVPFNNDSRQASIVYQSSRKDAIEFVKILAQADALPISAAKSKSAEAKRFDQLKDIVDKLTVQFVRDVETLRLLESVADAGDVKVAPVAGVPQVEDETDEEENFE